MNLFVAYPKYEYIKYTDAEESTKHWRLSLFRYETFINFLSLVFRHEGRETPFLLCWLFLHRIQPTPAGCLAQSQNLNSPRVKSQLTAFFQKSLKFPAHRFWARRHWHPIPISYLGLLLWHLWFSHPPRTSVNTCTKSRIVQSLTKPNDKI